MKIKLKKGTYFIPKTSYKLDSLSTSADSFVQREQIQMLNTEVEYEAKAARFKDFGAGYL